MRTVKIVFNGCDGYVELDSAAARGYEVLEGKLIATTGSFTPFSVTPSSLNEIPVDEEGEKVFEGFILTESGKVYREI